MHVFNLLLCITVFSGCSSNRIINRQIFRRQSPAATSGSQCDYNEAINVFPTNASTTFLEKFPVSLLGRDIPDGVELTPLYQQTLVNARLKLIDAIPTVVEEVQDKVSYISQMRDVRRKKGFIYSAQQLLEENLELHMSSFYVDQEWFYNVVPDLYKQTPNLWVQNRYSGLDQLSKLLQSNIDKLEASRGDSLGSNSACAGLANSIKSDPNGWKAGTASNAYNLVAGCYESFAFKPESMAQSLETLRFMVKSFYVYQGFLVKGYSLLDVIEAAIQMKPTLSNDYRSQQFLSDVLTTMAYDAGMRYYPTCYHGFIFTIPLMVESFVELRVRTVLRILKADPKFPALKKYEGAEIITIDEVVTLEALKTFSERRSYTMDHRTGYTRMLSRKVLTDDYKFGYKRGVYLKRLSLPFKPTMLLLIKMKNQRPEEIEVPWLVFQSPDLSEFTDKDSFWKNNCDPVSATNKDNKYMGDPGPTKMGTPPVPEAGKNNSLENLSDPDALAPQVTGPKFALYFLDDYFADGPYAVLVFASFDVGTSDYKTWIDSLLQAFKAIQSKGIKNLLLDFSGNTGGNVCLCYVLSAMFLPLAPYEPFPAAPRSFGSVVYFSRMLERMEKCSEEKSTGDKYTPFQMPFYQNHSTFYRFEKNNKWRDNRYFQNTQYSTLLRDYCVTKYTKDLENFRKTMKPLKVTILSDGYAGGCTGALMASLQFNNISAIVAITSGRTSIDTITAPVYAFPNIQLLSLSQVRDIAKGTSCESDIPTLPLNAQIYVPFRAGMTLNNTVAPLQISVMRSQYVIDVGTGVGVSVHGRWVNAIRKMNYTMVPEEIPDPAAYR